MESYRIFSLVSAFTQHYVCRFICVVACVCSSFIVIAVYYSLVRIYHNLFVSSPGDGGFCLL